MKPNILFHVSEKYMVGQPGEFEISINAPVDYTKLVITLGEFSEIDNIDLMEIYNEENNLWETLPNGLNFLTGSEISPIEQNFKLRIKFNKDGNNTLIFKLLDSEDKITVVAEETTVFEVDTEGTPYMEVYELFLNSITDERIAYLTIEEMEAEFLPLLEKAIFYLCRIAKVAGFDLHLRDDINQRFIQKLRDHEKIVLAFAMVVCWTEQQLNSTRFINQQYYDAGIKTYSPNETMRNLLALNEAYTLRLKNKITEYAYKVVDISQFGGNE